MDEVTITNATYLYHPEYLRILFHTNIDQSKKEQFLLQHLNDDIKVAVT